MSVVSEPRTRRWTGAEYRRMGECGFFVGQRVELIEGEVVEMRPKRAAHSVATSLAFKALSVAFGPGYWVRNQEPLRLGSCSEPEPDLAVVRGRERDFTEHPATALLVVESSDTTLEFDRSRKAALYAAAGIAEYWVVDLNARCLEVNREPVADPARFEGHRYATKTVLEEGQSVSPLARPGAAVAVSEFLP